MEKPQPFNVEIEMSLLSSLLYEPDLFDQVAAIITPEDFYRNTHRTIYSAMLALHERGEQADAFLLADVLERKHNITEINDIPASSYLLDLAVREPTTAYAEDHARRLAHLAQFRRLASAAHSIAQLAYTCEEDAVERAEELILAVKRQARANEFVTVGDYLPNYIEHLRDLQDGDGKMRGIETGISDLDIRLGGLQRGSLYIPAARPGVGKTTIVQNFAYNAATRQGKRVAFFSLEMNLNDLMDRFVSIHTGIDSQQLSNDAICEEDLVNALNDRYDEFEQMGIYLKFTPGISIQDLKSQARALVAKQKIDLVVVDYLQLVKATINGKRVTPREMEVAEVARELKQLAGELNVPVVAPAQINREIEKRSASKDGGEDLTYKMPMLSDLRESGELEQSADVVMFLARSEEQQERVKLVIAKNRRGPLSEIDLYFEGSKMRFGSVNERQQDE